MLQFCGGARYSHIFLVDLTGGYVVVAAVAVGTTHLWRGSISCLSDGGERLVHGNSASVGAM